ncbi:hypothetical protein SLEP1_g52340 [Rubroshorea leprosula]|uniref:Uncharacterized protein n=1 Tax=Rubroshorea leprosula TaxID=152421 RepID=A0AAV5M5Y3_9ROSI|nr:hypothetical protein SLEP1_g52340 [Rubroshorea leprosula]
MWPNNFVIWVAMKFLLVIQLVLAHLDILLLCHVEGTVIQILEAVLDVVPIDKLAVHIHDTYGWGDQHRGLIGCRSWRLSI